MVYRPRRLKQAKSLMSPAVLRYFMAPLNTVDDFYQCREEVAAGAASQNDLFLLYYANEWKNYWADHRATIEAAWQRQFPDLEVRATHRRWALQSYLDRIDEMFLAGNNENSDFQRGVKRG